MGLMGSIKPVDFWEEGIWCQQPSFAKKQYKYGKLALKLSIFPLLENLLNPSILSLNVTLLKLWRANYLSQNFG